MEIEIWKDVKGEEGRYQVSSFGRIKSLDGIRRNCKGRLLSLHSLRNGYPSITITSTRKEYVHILIAISFLGERPNGYVVDHMDRDRTNNRLTNLRYIPFAENVSLPGESNFHAKLTDEQVLAIRAKYVRFKYGTYVLAKEYNVTQALVHHIISRKAWKHI